MSQLDAFTDRDRTGHFLVWHKTAGYEPTVRLLTDDGLCFTTYGDAETAGDDAVTEYGGIYHVRDVGPDWFKARAS